MSGVCEGIEEPCTFIGMHELCAAGDLSCLTAASGKKKVLNVGRSGGSAGLDDFSYDTALDTDDIEFM